MSSTVSFFPKLTPFPTKSHYKHPNTLHSYNKHLLFSSHNNNHKHNRSTLSSRASAASGLTLPINVEYLKREFSGRGVSFEAIGESCVVKMRLANGSTASLMLPSGLITSYRPFMWHGANMEVLHTLVSERGGDILIQGGVSMELVCVGGDDDGGLSWSPDKWALLDVKGSSEQSIQLELVSVGQNNTVDVKCLVSLCQDLLGSEIIITNPSSSSIQLSGSVMSHLSVSTPEATYAVGLLGSNYHEEKPTSSGFSIIPPESGEVNSIQVHEERGDGEEEDDDYAQMSEKMCRIYTHAPREFTIIDRGKRNSVVVQRRGFDEFYVYSPGSDHEWYGKYAYVCIGPSAVLKPVVLEPGGSWTGAQYLFNPNL